MVVGSIAETATGTMVVHPDADYPALATLQRRLDARSRPDHNVYVDAAAVAHGLFGDTTMANVFLLGVAHQSGCIPVSAGSVERAIELNGVAVERNGAAFRWGRRWVVAPDEVERTAGLRSAATSAPIEPALPSRLRARVDALTARLGPDLGATLALRVADLADYQSARYAARYVTRVEAVADREAAVAPGSWPFTSAVITHLHKLLAYKDEYEVARLLLLPGAYDEAATLAGPAAKVTWHLHPPMLRALGMKRKIRLGPTTAPMFRALAAGKRLRGTALDPFGHAEVRKLERALITEYEAALDTLTARLSAVNRDEAAAIAALPDHVRGYEQLKVRRAAEYRRELERRLADLR